MRIRRSVAVFLLASLFPGLVAPVLAARGHGMASVYEGWLEDQLSGERDVRITGALDRLSEQRFLSLHDYVGAFVADLVTVHGLSASSDMLGQAGTDSAAELTSLLLEGLRSLSPGALPAAALLNGPESRSVDLARTSFVPDLPAQTDSWQGESAPPSVNPFFTADIARRPATGGAQPLGP